MMRVGTAMLVLPGSGSQSTLGRRPFGSAGCAPSSRRATTGRPSSGSTTRATRIASAGTASGSSRRVGRRLCGADRCVLGQDGGRLMNSSSVRSAATTSKVACFRLVYSKMLATSAVSVSGGVDPYPSNSITAMASGTTTAWKTCGCSARIATAKRKRSVRGTRNTNRSPLA